VLRGASTSHTVRAALAHAERALTEAGCDTPRLDAELLLAEALDARRAALYADLDRPLHPPHRDRFATLMARRTDREPVAYILGRRGFRGVVLHVDRRVLIPRPETELLVEAALELPRGTRVVDVGTGSGAVALAVKHERADLDVTATDLSAAALAVARENARRLHLDVRWRHCDLLAGLDARFDAVLANLPYVAARELDALMPEVSGHEPRVALDGGPDGLALLRSLCAQLGSAGFAALEIGAGQAKAVRPILARAGFARVEVRRDLAGIERVVVGRRT
jgi:release factor glutamine methyltransferase